jgi:TRAP-type C4-dicarboxylate transport system substrate-binding protein
MRTPLPRCLALALTASLAAGAASAETVLTFNWWVPPTHLFRTDVFGPWAEKVAEVTNGEVRIEFTATAVVPPPRQIEAIEDGVIDIALSVHGYNADRFSFPGVMEMPFMATSGEAASVAYWRAYETYFAGLGEHDGVKLLATFVHSPGGVMTRNRELRSIADFQGLLVRSGGGLQDRVNEALGSAVVSSPAPTTYELLSNGVVDATFMTPDSFLSFNLKDLVSVYLGVPGGLFNSSFYVMMNQDAYERIPEAVRPAFDSVTGEFLAALAGGAFDRIGAKGMEAMRAAGTTIIEPDAAFMAELEARLAPFADAWVEQIAAKGLDGREIIAFLKGEMAAHAPN